MARRLPFAFVCMLVLAAVALSADRPAAEEPVFDVNPVGTPLALGRRPTKPAVHVWFEDGAWHVRTRTARKLRRFTGTIQVQGGKVTKIENFGGLETGKKAKDLGLLNAAKTQIRFQFKTADKEDGFSFRLSPEATGLALELLVDGVVHPEMIHIGPNSQPAPGAKFQLPAHPDAGPR